VSRLFREQRVDGGLGDGFIHARGRAPGGDTPDALAIDLDWQSALIRKASGKTRPCVSPLLSWSAAALEGVCRSPRRPWS